MAELPPSSSTSEKFPIEKPGLGLLIPDTAVFDPVTNDLGYGVNPRESSNDVDNVSRTPELDVEGNVGHCLEEEEEKKLMEAPEREIYNLSVEQREIEAATERERYNLSAEQREIEAATERERYNLSAEQREIEAAIERERYNLSAEQREIESAIEREIYNLSVEQREIEVAGGILAAFDDADEWKEADAVRDSLGEEQNEEGVGNAEGERNEMNGKDSMSGEEENEIEVVDEWNVEGHVRVEASAKAGKTNTSNNRKRINYPTRPDAEDCAFYMKFGSCKFGSNCKFNHPPRRKNQGTKDKAKHREENSDGVGQMECKYYLTSGGCKFGNNCKYTHGSDKGAVSHASEFNFLGLPIRLGQKECPYYMRTGTCKYGSICRFHHPDPTTVTGGDSSAGYGNGGSLPTQIVSSSVPSWSSPRAYNGTSPFAPMVFPPNQGARTQNPEWDGYQATVYPTSDRSLPTPPAFAIKNIPTEIDFLAPQKNNMFFEDYPERPGEPECSFFLKTGVCKYKANCKFHHPKARLSKAKANSSSLSDKGLPLRPDQPICMHYHRYGICKYGPGCKYDHPSDLAILPPPSDQPVFANSNGVGLENSQKRNESKSSVEQA